MVVGQPRYGRAVAGSLGDAGFVACDVADKSQVESALAAAVDYFGTLDVLVNNAWGGRTVGLLQHPGARAGRSRHRFPGAALGENAAHAVMKPKGWGRIINMALNGVNAHMGTSNTTVPRKRWGAAAPLPVSALTGITVNVICLAVASFRRVMQQNPELRRRPTPATRWVARVIRTTTSHRSRSSPASDAAAISPATPCSSTAVATSTDRRAPDLGD